MTKPKQPKKPKQENEKQKETKPAGPRPIASYSAGAVSATIWANKAEGKNGKFTYPVVKLQRRYQDGKGEWQNANSLMTHDVPKAIAVLCQAYSEILFGLGKGGRHRSDA